jgi:hypothetical protein
MAARIRSSLLECSSGVLRFAALSRLTSIRLGLALSLILMPCNASPAGHRIAEGSDHMDSMQSSETNQLSPDLVPVFSERDASMVVAKVLGREHSHTNQSGVETGLLRLTLVRIVRSEKLKEGDAIETPFARVADRQIRLRNQFNAWNSLSLDPGELLLLGVKFERAPHTYVSLAAARVSSTNDPLITAAQQCYEIELIRDNPAAKKQLLTRALESPEDLLRFYALDVITRRHALNREDSVNILESAIRSEKTPSGAKRDIGFQLVSSDFYKTSLGPDPLNVRVVSVIAAQVVNSPDSKFRTQWLSFLSSSVSREFSSDPAKDRELRLSLVRAVRTPLPQQVIAALTQAVREAPSEADAKPAKRVLDIWQAALEAHR